MKNFINDTEKLAEGMVDAAIDYENGKVYKMGTELHKNVKHMKKARVITIGGVTLTLMGCGAVLVNWLGQNLNDVFVLLDAQHLEELIAGLDAKYSIDMTQARMTLDAFYANSVEMIPITKISNTMVEFFTFNAAILTAAGYTYYDYFKRAADKVLEKVKPQDRKVFMIFRDLKDIGQREVAENLLRSVR